MQLPIRMQPSICIVFVMGELVPLYFNLFRYDTVWHLCGLYNAAMYLRNHIIILE